MQALNKMQLFSMLWEKNWAVMFLAMLQKRKSMQRVQKERDLTGSHFPHKTMEYETKDLLL